MFYCNGSATRSVINITVIFYYPTCGSLGKITALAWLYFSFFVLKIIQAVRLAYLNVRVRACVREREREVLCVSNRGECIVHLTV